VEADGAAVGGTIPWLVAETIRQRMAALPEGAGELLGVAALIGRVVPTTLLLGLVAGAGTRANEERALEALEAACAAGLLRDERSAYQFTHDLIREVALADLSTARARRWHRRVAEALAGQSQGMRQRQLAAIADHYLAAGDSLAALPYAMQAGDQAAAAYAHAEAEQHYRTAVEVAAEVGDQAREAEALEKLSLVLHHLARYHEVLATIANALAAYGALGDVEGEARVAEGLQHAHYFLATPASGIARLGALLDDLRARGLSPLGQARLYGALAYLLHRSGWLTAGEEGASRLSEALVAAERAMDLARAAQNDGVLVHALFIRASTLLWLGRVEEAFIAHEELVPLAEAAGELRTLFNGLVHLQVLHGYRGEFALMQRAIDRCIALVDQVGEPRSVAHMWGNQAELAYYIGDWSRARAAIERSLEVVRAYDLGAIVPENQCYLAQLYLVAGKQEQAEALGAEPLAVIQEKHELQALRLLYSMIAERDLLAGRAQAVRTYLEPLLDRPGLVEYQVLYVLPQYAWALLALGEEAEAETRALQSCARARAWHYPLFLVDGLRVLALVRLRHRRWEEARALLQEAIAVCRAMPYPYAEAKALYVYGQLHTATGEPEQAHEHYEAALAICDRLGEDLYRPHIEHALAQVKAE
jgi:tetratricopeptide (TPR) repeat protein